MTLWRALDLFSGVGGWSLGMHRHGITTVAACEQDAWKRRHYARHFPAVRIYPDVCALTAEQLAHDGIIFRPNARAPYAGIDIIVGSPPCTDISTANTSGLGVDGPESRLYFEAIRLVREIGPRWVAFENSANLRNRGADRVLAEMEAAGYAIWPLVVGAGHAGAPHRRLRSWLVGCRADALASGAHADRKQGRAGPRQALGDGHEPAGIHRERAGSDADTAGLRLQPRRSSRAAGQGAAEPALAAADADGQGQHGVAVDGQVERRRRDAGSVVADRIGGGGNDADPDSARPPLGQVQPGDDGGQIAAIERGFGLGWANGPGALDRSLRAFDGVSARLARAATRRDRIAITSELARARSAYGDAVALPVVEAVIQAIIAAERELNR